MLNHLRIKVEFLKTDNYTNYLKRCCCKVPCRAVDHHLLVEPIHCALAIELLTVLEKKGCSLFNNELCI